jgi:hypothetical protein
LVFKAIKGLVFSKFITSYIVPEVAHNKKKTLNMDMQRSLIAFDSIFPTTELWQKFLRDIVDSIDNHTLVLLNESRLSRRLMDSLTMFSENNVAISTDPAHDVNVYTFQDHPLLSYKAFSADMWEYKIGVFRELLLIRPALGLIETDNHFLETEIDFSRHKDHAMLLGLFELNDIKLNSLVEEVTSVLEGKKWINIVIKGNQVGDIIYETLKEAFPTLPYALVATEADGASYLMGANSEHTLIRILPTANCTPPAHVPVFDFSQEVPPGCDVTFRSSVWFHKLKLYKASLQFVRDDISYDASEWYL